MYLKKSKSNGKIYLSFVEGYRVNGKVKQRTIKKIGYLEDLQKRYADPVNYFTNLAKQNTFLVYNSIKSDGADQSSNYYGHIERAPLFKTNGQAEEISLPAMPNGVILLLDEYSSEKASFNNDHWHHSLQFTIIMKGTLEVSINGVQCELHEGEGIFINSNVMHCMDNQHRCNCKAFTLHLMPSYLCSENEIVLYARYVAAITENTRLSHIVFSSSVTWQEDVLCLFFRAFQAFREQKYAYEWDIKQIIVQIWYQILRNVKFTALPKIDFQKDTNLKRTKIMISYIHEKYSDRISLKDIANSASISISECNRCFNNVLNQAPFEYLNKYRITIACKILVSSDTSISSIALDTGFPDYSHFNRLFRKYTGTIPRDYRKSHKQSGFTFSPTKETS